MKLKSQAPLAALLMLPSTGAYALECPPGSSIVNVDGLEICLLKSNVIVIIDPVWLVATAGFLLVELIPGLLLHLRRGVEDHRLARRVLAGQAKREELTLRANP